MTNDIFELRSASPMLLSESDPFDSDNHIYELKLDGIRCLAYLDKINTELRNKRNKILNETYPELNNIYKQIKKRCIIDGELIVLTNNKPDFYEVQRRSLMTDKFKIELRAKQKPVRFVAFDIIYLDDKAIIDLPLIERKDTLQNNIIESQDLAISRYIHKKGIDFYNLASMEDLEGVVAKKMDSYYYLGKRSKDWLKFKKMYDSDFVICGYVSNNLGGIKSLVLGAYKDNKLHYQGHVSLGISKEDEKIILRYAIAHESNCPFINIKEKDIKWFDVNLVCTVKYMMRTESGSLRQPVFKGLRLDKSPKDCVIGT